jgi:uncharacterized protein
MRLVRRKATGTDEIAWDPAAGEIQGARLEGVEVVVHLAGANLAGRPWTRNRKRRILDSRVQGTGLLANTLARLSAPPRVLISMSAIGFYGDRGETVLTESDDQGTGFLPEVVKAWEAAAEPARQAGIAVIHPRFGVVLDPAGGMLRPVLLPFKLGLGARLGSGRQWLSWVSLVDALGILRFLLEQASISGVVNATAPVPVTNAAFTADLAAVLHRPVLVTAPPAVLEMALGDLARELLLSSTRAVPARLAALGYQFKDPELRPALERMLRHH